jgi:AraC-like DNA-binding protein
MLQDFSQTATSLKEAATSFDNFQDEVILLEFDHSSLNNLKSLIPHNPSRFDTLLFIGITSGELEIQMDYTTHQVSKNSIVFIMPTHITYFTKIDINLTGWVLAISRSYITTLSYSRQQMPVVISYMQLKKNPLTVFDANEYQKLQESLDFVKSKMRKPAHLFYKETVNAALKMFFLDLGNYYLSKKEHYITPTLTRKEELFIDFQNLLREFCMKQHDVKFYADKLFITTQYLTSILKEQSGKSAIQWIQEALIIEAKGMLKSPKINIQHVADELNFPDQSTFGKFFKKHVGISPLSFRKS